MAWSGWMEWGGVEVVNATRVEAYAKHAGVGWFTPVYKATDLGLILGQTYTTPLQDDAPWVDPIIPATTEFLGVYPLSITGIDDSTLTAAIVENTGDGGTLGRPRLGTRSVVMSLALLATSDAGAAAGMAWLKTAVANIACGDGSTNCARTTLCYLNAEPCLDDGCVDPEDCLVEWRRMLINVAVVSGPTITRKAEMSDGGAVWLVTVTAVAANPWHYGPITDLVRGFMAAGNDDPYVGGAPVGAVWNSDGYHRATVDCAKPQYRPLYDPLCPVVIPPPEVPSVDLNCFAFPKNFTRRVFTIPADVVPLWGDLVPRVEIHTGRREVRSLRLRFYADLDGDGVVSDDPCAYCGDIVFTYIPANSTMVFDGAEQVIYSQLAGGLQRRAEALAFDSDGGPFDWPQLTCGYGYVVAVDLPQQSAVPSMDLALYQRAA